ncbi:protein kish [Iris pallida]|uniref:Protein kish n=1 Tax=Iris pallida TaxID=29817 RepID=A0AAX6GZL6_IRIPA|nr:protein kish [Iris pallida]
MVSSCPCCSVPESYALKFTRIHQNQCHVCVAVSILCRHIRAIQIQKYDEFRIGDAIPPYFLLVVVVS